MLMLFYVFFLKKTPESISVVLSFEFVYEIVEREYSNKSETVFLVTRRVSSSF